AQRRASGARAGGGGTGKGWGLGTRDSIRGGVRRAPSPEPRQEAMEDKRTELAEEFMRKLAAAIRAAQLYSARHPIIGRNAAALATAIEALHASQPAITLGIVDTEV